MKSFLLKISFLIAFTLVTVTAGAQKIEGIATYQTKTTIDISRFNRGGEQMTEQRKKQIMERMRNFLEKEYTLTFNIEESFYKEEERLAAPGSGMRFGGFSQGGIYSNRVTNDYARENNMMGKTFLVKDTLNNLEWELLKESKIIGQYPVFKATATRDKDKNLWESMRPRRDKNEAKKDTLAKDGDKLFDNEDSNTEVITAWYTPMIPASHGPDEYGGLPGLILELNAGNTVILCTKVVLNPQQSIEINPPTKGKVMSREEYKNLMEEKAKEMAERYRGGNRRGGGGGFRN